MDVFAWRKRVRNEGKPDEKETFEVYVFKNPQATEPLKGSGFGPCYSIHASGLDYKEWQIVNGSLSEVQKGALLSAVSAGFPKECFFYLHDPVNFSEISEKTGIPKKHLDTILSDYKTHQ